MSYDIKLCDPVTKETITVDFTHSIRGGTYCVGGDNRLWLNITYNYSKYYYNTIDAEKGIRFIYGKSGAESIPILESAIAKLGDDVSDNYWDATEGNAKQALHGLLAFAKLRPDGIWNGD
jgi:hypothetical protein